MAFVPIAASGVDFTFTPNSAETMDGSVVSADAVSGSAWNISFAPADLPLSVRVTAQSYATTDDANPASFTWLALEGFEEQPNESGSPSAFTPSPFTAEIVEAEIPPNGLQYFGSSGTEGSATETYSYLIEVEVETPETCQELGRTTRAYVSGYNRSKVHVARIRRQERRCVVADFNGAIPPSRSIVSVTWRSVQPWVTKMISAAISDREATVMVDFQNPGFGPIKATVELDNGEIYNQIFEFTVLDAPYFLEGTPVQGPYILTAP